MTSVATQMQKIRSENRLGLMTHIVVGYPNLAQSQQLVLDMAEAGVDFIELQIPFSDPIADGPTILEASNVALGNGVRLKHCFEMMETLCAQVDIPLFFMTYYNIIYRCGVTPFLERAAQAGVGGLIVPDMPVDEEAFEGFYQAAQDANVPVISVLAPVNTVSRLQKATFDTGCMLYLPSHAGVTGSAFDQTERLKAEVSKIKSVRDQPIAVGFGVRSRREVEIIAAAGADIAVVGTAVIKAVQTSSEEVHRLLSELVQACRETSR